MGLRLCLAGGLAADAGTRRAGEGELRDRRAQVALAVLVLERHRRVARDELAEIVWPEGPPPTWEPALRTVVSHVRAFLAAAGIAPGALMARSGCYELRLPDDAEVDVELATASVKAAEQAVHGGGTAPAMHPLRWARDVLARPLLPGVDTPWVDRRRDELRSLLVRALEAEAELHARGGEWAEAVEALEAALAAEPLRESAWRGLLQAHAGAGNRGEALRAYERCRVVLAEELGINPAPETETLYLRILREEGPAEVGPAQAETAVAPRESTALPGDDLARGQAALAGRDWGEAFAALSAADDVSSLGPEDLEGLAEAAMWSGRHHEAIAARQRAHGAYLDAGDRLGAARAAMGLVANHAIRLELAAAEGWFRMASSLLQEEPEGPAHGFLAFLEAVMCLDTGNLDGCLEAARRAAGLGRQFQAPDLEALGATFQGCALVRRASLREGLGLLDEGMARATTGRLSPLATGLIYCRTIWTCVELCDHRRAAEWIDTLETCGAATGLRGYPGDCHAHRSSVLVARGSWGEAEREAERACEECRAFDVSHVGLASYTLGLVRLRRGDLDGAEEAFDRANHHGVVPQPGLALLALARGDVEGALASVRGALELAPSGLARASLLPAVVDIAAAAGDRDAVAAAVVDLEDIARDYRLAAHAAALDAARGVLHHLEGAAGAAVRALRAAVDHYVRAEAPYEAARTRMRLAEALLAAGDRAGALLELRTARSLFERLGARPEAVEAAARVVLHEHRAGNGARVGRS